LNHGKLRPTRVKREIDVNTYSTLTCAENQARQTSTGTVKCSISQHVDPLPGGECCNQLGARHRRRTPTIQQARTSMRPGGEPGIDDDRRSDSMRQNREDIDNRSPNPTILEQDRLGTKETQRPRTWPKSLARNRPRLEGEVCAPRSEAPSRRPEDFQSNPFPGRLRNSRTVWGG